MRRLILRSFQSPGDILMLTAAVRDLHAAHPGAFQTDVRTAASPLWENSPHLTPLHEGQAGVEVLDMHYPLIHQSNQRPYHFLHGYAQYLEQTLGIRVPLTRFHGDVHLSAAEKTALPPCEVPERFWIVVAGGKFDFTAKWWDPAAFQTVADHFQGKIRFVQCGEAGHWHPRLRGVADLVGKTSMREFVRLMHHADGVLCPVTFAMHLAAAVETRPGRPKNRACVVVAGGREPPHWEAYPHHQYICTNGALPCCADGGCWRSRCQLVGDGDEKDRVNLCELPVQISLELRIPRCMEMIGAADVIRRIELYYQGGALHYAGAQLETASCSPRPRFGGEGLGVRGRDLCEVSAPSPQPLSPRFGGEGLGVRGRDLCEVSAPSPQPLSPAKPGERGFGGSLLPSPNLATPEAAMHPAPVQIRNKTVLLEFRHGLGDAVQLTVVLQHLKHYHPEWEIDVAALPGKHSAFHGLCRRVLVLDRDAVDRSAYDRVFSLDWPECSAAHADAPSTKPTRCLLEVFRLTPLADLCRYAIQQGEQARDAARRYLAEICRAPDADGRYRAVLIHYEGNTSSERKNLSHDLVREVCEVILACGAVPVILDWDRRSPLPDGVRIHNPGADHPLWRGLGTGDAETLAALIEASRLMIGVDSGPLHAAGATATPTLGVWTLHHPVHFFDLADNVTHLVPGDHAKFAASWEALRGFESRYRHRVYKQLGIDLPALVESLLTGEDFERLANKRFLGQLSATGYGSRYYHEHKAAGLDYLGFGDWQRQYGRWLAEALGLRGKRVLEVGCACGSVMRGLGEAGMIVQGVDVNEFMIRLGREKWPDMAGLLFVCDAVSLHLFEDASWDGLHSAQVAEHWKPELVPFILRELGRVTRPGGLFFCCLDTEELFARQGRKMETEDPTHVCIRPLGWWHEQLANSGWELCSDEFLAALRDHPDSFLKRYDWDWFVARRTATGE